MEKWLVIAGIWMMFALCAILFIRGATRPSDPDTPAEPDKQPDAARADAPNVLGD